MTRSWTNVYMTVVTKMTHRKRVRAYRVKVNSPALIDNEAAWATLMWRVINNWTAIDWLSIRENERKVSKHVSTTFLKSWSDCIRILRKSKTHVSREVDRNAGEYWQIAYIIHVNNSIDNTDATTVLNKKVVCEF